MDKETMDNDKEEDLKATEEATAAAEAEEGTASTASQAEGSASAAPAAEKENAEQAPDLATLEAALAAEKDKNVRLYADFENFRRRMERERLETWARAEHEILAALLPVVDNFDRAMAQAGDDPFSEGVRMVHSSLIDFLAKREVTTIATVGEPFDTAIHEAVAYQPSPDAEEGIIIYETRRGYMVGNSVLRPASVIVSSGKPETK